MQQAVVCRGSLLFAELLSLSIGTLHARYADLASRTFAATQTTKVMAYPPGRSASTKSPPQFAGLTLVCTVTFKPGRSRYVGLGNSAKTSIICVSRLNL